MKSKICNCVFVITGVMQTILREQRALIQFIAFFGILFCGYTPGASAQAYTNSVLYGKCITAFQRDTAAMGMVPPLAFCNCVVEHVAASTDDKKIATDRAGLRCLQIMKSPNSWSRGFARGANESCMKDPAVQSALPGTFQSFCICYGKRFAELMVDQNALRGIVHSDPRRILDAKREEAVESCAI